MKQILQNLRNGETEVAEVPCPGAGLGKLLIATRRSLVSAGTERMLVDFGKASLIDKVRQQPDKVWMVLDKVRTLRAARPDLRISIDGGIKPDTAALAVAAGATQLVAGSAVFRNPDNYAAALAELGEGARRGSHQ